MWVCEPPESNLTVSATRPELGRLGAKDRLPTNEQQLYMITRGSHVGDVAHVTGKNSGRVARPGITFDNVHVIVKNLIGAAMIAVTLFKPSPDRLNVHAAFIKDTVHNE